MTAKVLLVTGGTRSGKSCFAEEKAKELSPTPLYLATAEVRDEEMQERVALHQARRGAEWHTIEEPLHLSSHLEALQGQVVLIDCLTLWATSAFFHCKESTAEAYAFIEAEWQKLTSIEATYIMVTNEIGLGGIASTPMMRAFADLQGSLNQMVARTAEEVYFVVSGIPLRIK